MNVLVVGGGGREHTIICKIKENPNVETIYALPGNGGIAQDAECVPIGAKDIDGIAAFAESHKIDFAVVAPDDPLVLGAVDRLEALGIPCFGPRANAAIIEGSKVFSKDLMKKYNIPTAGYEVFTDSASAAEYVKKAEEFPIVLKADGLALGKGVLICETKEEALAGIQKIMEDKAFGDSGNQIVIEEFLTGPEVSVLAFTDGKSLVPMVSSMDHKRALDNDQGLNTGGMGTVAPNPFYTKEVADVCMETIFLPTIRAMVQEGRPFKGCLYFGLMITPKGPKVIEYNCRFGDPESQVVLPLLKSDLLTIMQAVADERLSEVPVEFADGACACVVIASGGYPESYKTGYPVELGASAEKPDVSVFHAGTKLENGVLVTSGGRVLGVSAVAEDLPAALDKAYDAVKEISFEGMFYRKDIGRRALSALSK